MSPFPTGRVIPSGWAARHGAVSLSAMNATCTITRAATIPEWDPATGPVTDSATLVLYEGPCRVTGGQAPGTIRDGAGQPVTPRTYTIAVPEHVQAAGGDTVTLDTAPEHPGVVGRAFHVESVSAGTLAFEALLTCTDLGRR